MFIEQFCLILLGSLSQRLNVIYTGRMFEPLANFMSLQGWIIVIMLITRCKAARYTMYSF